ncbi:MAG: biotin transporter BioY [Pseudohongiellaceae bacterium]
MQANTMTLAAAAWPSSEGQANWLRYAVLALAGTAILALSAQFKVPFGPVPFTMQTFVVLVMGMVYGRRLAVATVALYLAEGAIGLPVFANGGGIAYFAGPTAGFLLAFLVAATLLGALAERGWGRSFTSTIGAMLIGTAVIFAGGLAWLGSLIGYEKAVAVGFMPFIFSESAKIILAALVMPGCWRLVRRRSE